MSYTHYAPEERILDRAWTYDQNAPDRGHMKPAGLWVSVDGEDDWKQWCEAEEYCPERLTYPHRVTLSPHAKLLEITDDADLWAFHNTWSMEESPLDLVLRSMNADFRFRQRYIDWAGFAREYDGLIIAPYQWNNRMFGPMWYYGWDCSSGCIWNLEAIKDFELVSQGLPAGTEVPE